MRSYILRAWLESGITVHRPIHLDGLLLAARERRDGIIDVGRPLDCIELDRGVYRASAGILVADDMLGSEVTQVARVWRFRTEDRIGLSFFRLHDENGPVPRSERRLELSNNPWKNSFRTQDVHSGVSSVAWQFAGDPDRVLALAREVQCLGASSATGCGRVRRWKIEDCDAAGNGIGWYSGDRVLRNLPVELAPPRLLRHGVGHIRTMERIAPPYWQEGDRRDCLVPAFPSLFANGDVAEQRLSYAA